MYKRWIFSKTHTFYIQVRRSGWSKWFVSAPVVPRYGSDKARYHEQDVDLGLDYLRDPGSKDVASFMRQENRYSGKYFQQTSAVVRDVFSYFNSLNNGSGVTDVQYREVIGDYEYYCKETPGLLPVIWRRKSKGACTEMVVLDQNRLALQTGYIKLGPLKVSPNEKMVAFTADVERKGSSSLYTVDLVKGSIPRKILDRISLVEWLNDDVLLVVEHDPKANRNNVVLKYSLANQLPSLLFNEDDDRFSVSISKSKSGKFVFLNSMSDCSTEVHMMSAKSSKPHLVWSKERGVPFYVDHIRQSFYCLTTNSQNEHCVKQISDCDIWDAAKQWKAVNVPVENEEFIHDMSLLDKALVVHSTKSLVPRLHVISYDTHETVTRTMIEDSPGLLEVDSHVMVDDDTLLSCTYTSPVFPTSRFALTVKNGKEKTWTSSSLWDSESYQYLSATALSVDGTPIPISVYSRKHLNLARAPMLVTAYGSYGRCANLSFNVLFAYLLSRGWMIAVPHVRGGGELGRKWHLQATRSNKDRTFQDFESSVRHLHATGYGSPSKTALMGTSAGALPVAVLLNRCPGLCAAAVMKVPFLSVLHAMLQRDGPLTSQEYSEWGNPRENVNDFRSIQAYCPFVNLSVCKVRSEYFSCLGTQSGI